MIDDPVHRYLAARSLSVTPHDEADKLVKALRASAEALQHWKLVEITNIAGVSYPLTGAGTRECDPVKVPPWPTAEQLAHALSRWQQAQQEAVRLYDALSAAERQGVYPPLASR